LDTLYGALQQVNAVSFRNTLHTEKHNVEADNNSNCNLKRGKSTKVYRAWNDNQILFMVYNKDATNLSTAMSSQLFGYRHSATASVATAKLW